MLSTLGAWEWEGGLAVSYASKRSGLDALAACGGMGLVVKWVVTGRVGVVRCQGVHI